MSETKLIHGDCLIELAKLEENSVHACVTDPPYELGFMGRAWDKSGIAYNVEMWKQVLRVLKPGAHLLAFGGSRTYHRMACAVEDAGFEIRDQIMWLYGSGFPKSLNVALAIDKEGKHTAHRGKAFNMKVWGERAQELDANGRVHLPNYQPVSEAAKQWDGWGTALKPAHEPIVVARKPLIGTVAKNVTVHGCGALNIEACRVADGTETGGEKPALMLWFVRLVTPPNGIVLDPFAGSGTTGKACLRAGFDFIGIEREAEHKEIARKRLVKRGLFY